MAQSYRPDIDGLRTMAVLPVVFYHAGLPGFSGGYVGVDIFFVISGFLITSIIYGELSEGRFSILRFYERRARRILPALFVVILASMIVGWFTLIPADYDEMGQSILSALLFVSNIWFWQTSGGYFQGGTDYLPMLHTWSLAVEEQFYILFPLLLMALQRFARRLLLPAAVLLVVMSFLLAAWATPRMLSASFYLLPTRIWELGFGSLLAMGLLPTAAPKALREGAGVLGLMCILLPVFLYDSRTSFPGLAALPPVLGATLLIWAGTPGPTATSRLLSLRPMVWIGLISYSLYLWHWPIMAFVRNRLFTVELDSTLQMVTILASVLAGWISWHFIERPFRMPVRDRSWRQGQILRLSAVGMTLLGGLAGLIILTGGMMTQRFTAEQLAAVDSFGPLQNRFRDTCFGPRPSNHFCILGSQDPDAPIEWMLWGDSHADALLPALNALAEQRGVRLAFAGHTACAPLPGLARTDLPDRSGSSCNQHNEIVIAFLRQTQSITKVFLHARWALFTAGKYSPSDDGREELILYPIGQPIPGSVEYVRNTRLVEDSLIRTIMDIATPEREIVLIGDSPEVLWNVPRRKAAQLLFGWPLPPLPSPQEVNARQATATAALDRVSAATGSFHIALAAAMCRVQCEFFTDTEMYYADDDHLSPLGATMLAQPVLMESLGPPPRSRE